MPDTRLGKLFIHQTKSYTGATSSNYAKLPLDIISTVYFDYRSNKNHTEDLFLICAVLYL